MQSADFNKLPEADLLLEIGHVALAQGFLREGMLIMDALVELQPEAPHPQTGRALGLHISGRTGEAIDELRGVIGKFPKAMFARALLAVFLRKAGDVSALEIAQDVLTQDPPSFVAELLKDAFGQDLDFIEFDESDETVSEVTGQGQFAGQSMKTAYPPGMRGKPV